MNDFPLASAEIMRLGHRLAREAASATWGGRVFSALCGNAETVTPGFPDRAASMMHSSGLPVYGRLSRQFLDAERTFVDAIHAAWSDAVRPPARGELLDPWSAWSLYLVDAFQRSVLFWDTIRERGNDFVAQEQAGSLPPRLPFDHEVVVDGRQLPRPVSYSLVRIRPPEGTKVDDLNRPFVIIDPRSGYGPGIGTSQDESQIGVALRGGHPVYFVLSYPRPEPGQTLEDVAAAEAAFLKAIVQRHPESPRPAVIGNRQAGWPSVLSASQPDITGPVVLNGLPMPYGIGEATWEGDHTSNRYLAAMLGGSWLAMWTSDLGHGLVDGAHFVATFERQNPANAWWNKYYQLYANVDEQRDRFLYQDRWWGGSFLMDEQELSWIVDRVLAGKRPLAARTKTGATPHFELTTIRSPIVVVSSGDENMTPAERALHWISGVNGGTEEILANRAVIVGLSDHDLANLDVFVSGRVVSHEQGRVVEVLDHVESLRPGLYWIDAQKQKDATGKVKYDVLVHACRVEDFPRDSRAGDDAAAFEVVERLSSLGGQWYGTWVRPWVRAWVSESTAEWGRLLHPCRIQRWALSDWNPWLKPLPGVALSVRETRIVADADNPFRRLEGLMASTISAGWTLYRDLRDTGIASLFHSLYGQPAVLGMGLYQGLSPTVEQSEHGLTPFTQSRV